MGHTMYACVQKQPHRAKAVAPTRSSCGDDSLLEMEISFVVLSMPHLAHRLTELKTNFIKHEFPLPGVKWGLRSEGSSIQQRNKAIFATHETVAREFLSESRADVLAVFEDDARWIGDASPKKLQCVLQELNKRDWVSCHLGQVPMGPIVPCMSMLLCRSLRPYGAHAYLLNGRTLRKTGLPSNVPCTRPYFFEGMTAVPWQHRFATIQPLATQIEPPMEMPKWAARTLSYESWAILITLLWLIALSLILLMVVGSVLLIVLYSKKETASLAVDGGELALALSALTKLNAPVLA